MRNNMIITALVAGAGLVTSTILTGLVAYNIWKRNGEMEGLTYSLEELEDEVENKPEDEVEDEVENKPEDEENKKEEE